VENLHGLWFHLRVENQPGQQYRPREKNNDENVDENVEEKVGNKGVEKVEKKGEEKRRQESCLHTTSAESASKEMDSSKLVFELGLGRKLEPICKGTNSSCRLAADKEL
jgi:hypothetical protein